MNFCILVVFATLVDDVTTPNMIMTAVPFAEFPDTETIAPPTEDPMNVLEETTAAPILEDVYDDDYEDPVATTQVPDSIGDIYNYENLTDYFYDDVEPDDYNNETSSVEFQGTWDDKNANFSDYNYDLDYMYETTSLLEETTTAISDLQDQTTEKPIVFVEVPNEDNYQGRREFGQMNGVAKSSIEDVNNSGMIRLN